ncbi:unnamed protein product [Clonostachys rosea]|uniref:non-specific serine/threonine protein kinase n=1 Tax=Bionectria ochroleuca TaxID=29856 RepID=A0ABY6U5L4_BIOOC|nr:unnamed protein product [Clonostachys rosea]
MGHNTIAFFTASSPSPQLWQSMKTTLKDSQYFAPQPKSALKLPTTLCLEVKCDSVPSSREGITFGWSKNCGVVLPDNHLTFDNEDRLVINDHSTHGTEVKYGGQGAGFRANRQWILNDPNLPSGFRHIEISVAGVISFKVDVRLMMSSEQSYRRVVDRFQSLCEEKKTDLTSDFQRATVKQTSGEPDLDTHDIWLHWQVGKGTSAGVIGCWQTETGIAKAVKTPLKDYDEEKWSQEVKFLKSLTNHHHVVKILGYTNTSDASPIIELKYHDAGSLDEPRDPFPFLEDPSHFLKEEATSILAQCLSVLVEMHEKSPPIVHRDIKPANILINRPTSAGICIKVADFGEANTEGKEGTFAGDPIFVAPEFWQAKCAPPLDIWSLGMTTLRLFNKPLHQLYCTREDEFRMRINQSEDSLVQFLRDRMLQDDPSMRSTAAECLQHLRELQRDDGIRPCGCSDCFPCFEDCLYESEDEGVKTPTMSNAEVLSSNSSTPTQKKLANGQSTETTTCSPADGSSKSVAESETVGESPTSGDTGGLEPASSASPLPTVGEVSVPTDEGHVPRMAKRRAGSDDEDDLPTQKRAKPTPLEASFDDGE